MLVCRNCGGHKVETRAWLDANTAEFVSWGEGDNNDNWCRDCESHTELVFEDEYRAEQAEDRNELIGEPNDE